MNLCFIIGKIVSDIEFKFIINSKKMSVAMFDLELLNESIIQIKGYNEIADYCYRNLEERNVVCLEGFLSNNEVIIETIGSEGFDNKTLWIDSGI